MTYPPNYWIILTGTIVHNNEQRLITTRFLDSIDIPTMMRQANIDHGFLTHFDRRDIEFGIPSVSVQGYWCCIPYFPHDINRRYNGRTPKMRCLR